ncbi:MAG: SDR family oxidoreductase [Phyllobacteriaceae bacterium]|jgi:3-oxoacyl-[acyl-carrier protein] reductase|nr:SDR family oxidoreductase [Phyllobacteriaceae bacterium]
MDLHLTDMKALVCGASRGLGYACALELAREGATVTLVARSGAALTEAAETIETQTGRRPATVIADLSTIEGREAAIASCTAPDILITNAGGPPSQSYDSLTNEDWQKALATNFLAAEALIRSIVPKMAARGHGRVVNITSMSVRVPVPDLDLSTAPRLALTGYVAGVARKVAARGVTLNCVLPGPILTERIAELGDTADALIADVPMKRGGTPEEFAAACVFLCSRQAAFITGQNLLVDGGLCRLTM